MIIRISKKPKSRFGMSLRQIAVEMGVRLVSYSMTHHTCQSALGLPFIEKNIRRQGILSLDEINCVSKNSCPCHNSVFAVQGFRLLG